MENKWDELYRNGAKYKPLNELFLNSLLEKVRRLSGRKPESVLDLGCGTGEAAAQFVARGLEVMGVDISAVAVEEARKKELAGAEFVSGDIEKLDSQKMLKGKEFDLIFCKLTIAFVKDKTAFLKQVKKTMGRKTVFCIITPVLRKGIEYRPEDKPGIAVHHDDFGKLMKESFGTVRVLPPEYTGERGEIRTYLAMK